jgi:hypothetical protein
MTALSALRSAVITAGLTPQQADELARNLLASLPAAIEDAAVECVEHRVACGWLELDAAEQERVIRVATDVLSEALLGSPADRLAERSDVEVLGDGRVVRAVDVEVAS